MKTLIIIVLVAVVAYSYVNNVTIRDMAGMAKKEMDKNGYEVTMPIRKKEELNNSSTVEQL